MFWIVVLVIHGLLAIALLGAVTHQAVSLFGKPARTGFAQSYAAVRSRVFTNAIIALYALTFVMGSWLYTFYRYAIRPVLEDLGAETYVGLFEYKEHVLAIGLCMMPAYWLLWHRVPITEQMGARRAVTVLIAVTVWIGLLAGHLVNNARGI
ncbi:MAG: hypothetical protein C0409_00730 [Novosphingobium sp.]|nr:hypothetical protein [Novosphingobium sp.]